MSPGEFFIVAIAKAFEAPADCPKSMTLFFTNGQHKSRDHRLSATDALV